MDDLQEITKKVEYIFMKQIVKGLENNTMTPEDARKYAKEYLPIEPFQSLEDVKLKVTQYVTAHEQFRPVQEYVEAYHSDKEADEKVAQMKSLIQENKIDEAIQVAKG